MWLQLGLAALKSLQDQRNKQNDIASNVITQKYSPYTGQRADFSSQGKGNGIGNLISGFASGLLQDKLDAEAAAGKAPELTKAQVEGRAAEAAYKFPSSTVASAARSPIRSPAMEVPESVVPQGNASSFASLLRDQQYKDPTPLMLQGQVPGQENIWLRMARGY